MKLSILMITLSKRRKQREILEKEIRRQMTPHGKRVELLILEDNGESPSGSKRNHLMRICKGDYFCFVDDDDGVAPNYVDQIVEGIKHGADVISFDMLREDGIRSDIISFSHEWKDRTPLEGKIGYRANHLCAWRKEVGSKVCFPPHLGYNDDVFWYKPLFASGVVKSGHHIDKVLYLYDYRPNQTANQTDYQVKTARAWAGEGIEFFWLRGEIVSSVNDRMDNMGKKEILVRDMNAREFTVRAKKLKRFCVVRTV